MKKPRKACKRDNETKREGSNAATKCIDLASRSAVAKVKVERRATQTSGHRHPDARLQVCGARVLDYKSSVLNGTAAVIAMKLLIFP